QTPARPARPGSPASRRPIGRPRHETCRCKALQTPVQSAGSPRGCASGRGCGSSAACARNHQAADCRNREGRLRRVASARGQAVPTSSASVHPFAGRQGGPRKTVEFEASAVRVLQGPEKASKSSRVILMPKLEIHQFPCLADNFGVLIRDAGAGVVASIDAPDARAVAAALATQGWRLTHILTTHHHGDHTGGNLALKGETGCTIFGPRAEAAKVPGIDTALGDGDAFKSGGYEVRVLDTPGHTAGHISYWIPSANVAFVGDTLFAIGCGRVIEGNHEMMWHSLQKLMGLPKETAIYCGHEY